MPFTFLLFLKRHPALTPAEFKSHWDTTHMALVQSIVGDAFPVTHTRRYIARPQAQSTEQHNITATTTPTPTAHQQQQQTWPATVLLGTQADFPYDGVAELKFANEAAFREFMARVSSAEAQRRIQEDEERFTVRGEMRAVVVGGQDVTRGSQE